MTTSPDFTDYLCSRDDLNQRMASIDPRAYDRTRNYLDGSVTWLSPLVTHGVLSTRQMAEAVLQEHTAKRSYRFLFELAWREFFHRTWQLSGDEIFDDMLHAQNGVRSDQLSAAIADATTGIHVIDECIDTLKNKGLMHNHGRMWVAAIACNMTGTYWKEPARWLHYHLLDGDPASNTLSWQWIAGTFSHKQYVANQGNIDKYSKTRQPDSWLDVPYEAFDNFSPPAHMLERCSVDYASQIPGSPVEAIEGELALRSVWDLDPLWQKDIKQHVVFVDTQWHERWPMSPLRWQFIEHWAKQCNAVIYHGTTEQLRAACTNARVTRREYPACETWPGDVQERDWLYPMPENTFPSFSRFFKQVKHHVGL